MRKIIWKDDIDTFKKGGISLVFAFCSAVLFHSCYDDTHIMVEVLAQNLFWYLFFHVLVAFWAGWVAKEYWVEKEKDKDRV